MKEMLEQAFARYGRSSAVEHGGEATETKAFIQPLTREKRAEPFSPTPLGAVDEHCWRYLGPAAVEIAMGDRVCCGAEKYIVRDTAQVFVGDRCIYRWAVLAKEEETA